MKDLPKQIWCANVETTAIGGEVSCSSNNIEHVINDPIVAHRKGRRPYLRKQSSLKKKNYPKEQDCQKNKVCLNAYICFLISFGLRLIIYHNFTGFTIKCSIVL